MAKHSSGDSLQIPSHDTSNVVSSASPSPPLTAKKFLSGWSTPVSTGSDSSRPGPRHLLAHLDMHSSASSSLAGSRPDSASGQIKYEGEEDEEEDEEEEDATLMRVPTVNGKREISSSSPITRVPAYGSIPIITGSNARTANQVGLPVQSSLSSSKGKEKQVVDLTEDKPETIDLDHYLPSPLQFGTPAHGPTIATPPSLAPNSAYEDKETKQPICFGEIRTAALLLYDRPREMRGLLRSDIAPRYKQRHAIAGKSLEYNDPESIWEPVFIESRPSVRTAGHYDMRVLTQQGENLGVVEEKVSMVLGGPWMQGLVWGEARIERKRQGFVTKLNVTVYGHPFNAMTFPTLLYRHNIYLEQPLYFDHRARYHNPHNPPPGGFAAHPPRGQHHSVSSDTYRGRYSLQGGGAGNTITRGPVDTASQVDGLFKSLGTSADTPEIEQPRDLITPLYKHQKQAIWFIQDREALHDFDEEEEADQVIDVDGSDGLATTARSGKLGSSKKRMISLFQKTKRGTEYTYINVITNQERLSSPEQCRGCIIADDMGLGKTASALGAVLISKQEAYEFAQSEPAQLNPKQQKKSKKVVDSDSFSMLDLGRSHSLSGRYINQDSIMFEKARVAKQTQKRKLAEALSAAENIQPTVRSKATLIVAPLSTVAGWEQQIAEHVTSGALSVYIYHGASRNSDPHFLTQYDIIITTYNILSNEFSRAKRTKLQQVDGGGGDEDSTTDLMDVSDDEAESSTKVANKSKKRRKGSRGNRTLSPLQLTEWFRIILDEAHVIKDPGTIQSRAVCALRAQRRVCLTGTPVQNHLNDLYALIKFLHLMPLDDRGVWNQYIASPVKYADPNGITRLQLLMRSLCLRRTKTQKDSNGKPILELPLRRDVIREVHLGPKERALYDSNAARTKQQFNDLLSKGLVMKNMVSILQEIMRLRQICTHFGMVEDYEDKRDADRLESDPHHQDLGRSIDDHGLTPKRARLLFTLLRDSGSGLCCLCGHEFSETEDPVVARCQHIFCIDCVHKEIWKTWPAHKATDMTCCPACRRDLQVAVDLYELKHLDPDGEEADDQDKTTTRVKAATNFKSRSAGVVSKRPQGYDVQHSSKVLLLTEELLRLREQEFSSAATANDSSNKRPIKTVVFSQWTRCLNRIEDALDEVQIPYRRLDGTMDRASRAEALNSFANDDNVLVFLISLRAGGVGLNLTAGSRVYLMEPSWNPQAEAQAVDRIHRLGQTREVDIIRLIVPDSVESNMLKLQQRKLMLAQVTLSERMSKEQMTAARLNELKALFK